MIRLCLVVALIMSAGFAQSQYTITVAGNGISACYQNDYALCTPFGYPYSVWGAANGDLYITCGNSLKKVSYQTKAVTRIAGTDTWGGSGDGGPAAAALMQFAKDVCLDPAGNIYIAEYGGHRVRKITALTGIITTIAGTGVAGFSGDGGLATSAQLNQPQSISLDPDGNLFITEFMNHRIRRVDAISGIITTYAGNGTNVFTGDGGLAAAAGVPYPNHITHDKAGNLYITEAAAGITSRLRKVERSTGIITTIAGNATRNHSGDGGLAVNATLIEPNGVAIDSKNNIYVVEYVGSRVRKIDAVTGIIKTIAGTGVDGYNGDGPALTTSLNLPNSIFIDAQDNIFIADNFNLRVRKIVQNIITPPVINPVLTISANTTSLCSNTPLVFTANASFTGPAPMYTWKKNNVIVSSGSPTFTGSGLNGGDIITCELSTSICNTTYTSASNQITITGQSATPLSVSIVSTATNICAGQLVNFTANTPNNSLNPSYQWKLNGNNVGNDNAAYSASNLANGDIISCVITVDPALTCNNANTASSNTIAINVLPGMLPTISISASVAEACPGTPITFSATTQNAGSNPAYQWKLNGNNIGTNSASFTWDSLADADEVSCILTSTNPCSPGPISSNLIQAKIYELPVIAVTPMDTIVKAGAQVNLKAIISGPAQSYTWAPANLVISPGALTTLTVPVTEKTVYTFTVNTPDGCSAFARANIKPTHQLVMPNAFTPNADGRNDVFRIPANTSLELKEFSVFDRWGNKIFTTKDAAKGWDGKNGRYFANAGTYAYIITGIENDKTVSFKGTFTLIR